MQPKRNALGRGLDTVFSMTEIRTDGSSAINEINIDEITPNPEQPRTNFEPETIRELADSIRELGIIQPLSLRALDSGKYQIIAGERRWRAARIAGLRSVPAYVRSASDMEITEMALIENIQREDLNAIEVALAFKKLIDTYSLTQERLSERLGKKRTTIANHLRLLRLPAEIQIGLRDRLLDMGHARALLAIDDPKTQLKIYKTILKEGISVRKVEEIARKLREEPQTDPTIEKAHKNNAADYTFFRKKLETYFPSPVKFSCDKNGKGAITLKFSNHDELTRLVEIFEKLKSDPE